MAYSRPVVAELETACRRRQPLIQVIVGPRQVGKSTAAHGTRVWGIEVKSARPANAWFT